MTDQQAYQDSPNTHKYTTANHITTWTVIPLHDPVTAIKHYYHVPIVLVEEIERVAATRASAGPLDAAAGEPDDIGEFARQTLREAAQQIASLSEDDIRDYEQGLCFFCGAGHDVISGPRGGVTGERRQKPRHEATCSYVALNAALAPSFPSEPP